jgi:hypothetical protein
MTDPMPLGAPDRLELGEGIRWADGRLVCVDILTGRLLTRAPALTGHLPMGSSDAAPHGHGRVPFQPLSGRRAARGTPQDEGGRHRPGRHHSDFWTNPASQIRPTDWAGYSRSRLEKAIYDYTAQSVRAMRAAGVTPEYVSIGNEINNALADVSRWTSPADYCALLESASKAVRDTSPTSRSRPWRTSRAGWARRAGNRSWRWGPATRGRPRRTARARRL